jgi:hypothetical protein
MSKISYASLKLKNTNEVKTIDFMGNNIEVLQYLPVEDKYTLMMSVLEQGKQNDIYNPFKIDIYFHLYLVYMYTNINFTDKQRENENKLYDALCGSGLLDEIISAIPENEYVELQQYIEAYIDTDMNYKTTVAALIKSIINDLPKQAEAMQDILNNFDKEKFKEVIEFAKEANGGRKI